MLVEVELSGGRLLLITAADSVKPEELTARIRAEGIWVEAKGKQRVLKVPAEHVVRITSLPPTSPQGAAPASP